jgi:hypothetical protein
MRPVGKPAKIFGQASAERFAAIHHSPRGTLRDFIDRL